MKNNFAEQMMNAAIAIANSVAALSPLVLVIGILGIAGINGLIELNFQQSIVSTYYAIAFASVITCFRFATGFGGIHLIKHKTYPLGVLFLATSVAITFYIASHIGLYAGSVTLPGIDITLTTPTLRLIVWSGLWGEVLLAGFILTTQTGQKADNTDTKDSKGLVNVIKGFLPGNSVPDPVSNERPKMGFHIPSNENRAPVNIGESAFCEQCHNPYHSKHHKQKYCSSECRYKAWDIRNKKS